MGRARGAGAGRGCRRLHQGSAEHRGTVGRRRDGAVPGGLLRRARPAAVRGGSWRIGGIRRGPVVPARLPTGCGAEGAWGRARVCRAPHRGGVCPGGVRPVAASGHRAGAGEGGGLPVLHQRLRRAGLRAAALLPGRAEPRELPDLPRAAAGAGSRPAGAFRRTGEPAGPGRRSRGPHSGPAPRWDGRRVRAAPRDLGTPERCSGYDRPHRAAALPDPR